MNTKLHVLFGQIFYFKKKVKTLKSNVSVIKFVEKTIKYS